jgi:hypothetical protein
MSDATAAPSSDLPADLRERTLARFEAHRRAWRSNEALRTLYRAWYQRLRADLPARELGPWIEIGPTCPFPHREERGSLAAMKDALVRFGVALEGSLLRDLDAVVRERGGTRSELFRDLARAEVGRAKVPKAVDAIATLDHGLRPPCARSQRDG